MKDVVGNCFLCGEHSLHVMGTEESQVMQCINCGYTTSTKYMGPKEDNEEYKKLPDDMKKWSKWENNRTWIPTIMTLPIGMLYPMNDEENYKNPQGGFYEKKIDTENPKIYNEFLMGMSYINELMKKYSQKPTELKLPKLKKK
jgi:transcription elongation factor Elf1